MVRLEGAPPIPDTHGGVWLNRSDPAEIAIPSGAFHFVVVTSKALPDNELIAVAGSIPVVANRDALYGSYEVPLDLDAVSDDQLAGLMSHLDANPRVAGRGWGEAQVLTSTVFLSLFDGDGLTVPDFATTLPLPRLITADRPVIVGESTARRRVYAIWDQRGYGWCLEGQVTVDEITAIALDVIDRVAALETG